LGSSGQLAYKRLCKLGIEDRIPHHFVFFSVRGMNASGESDARVGCTAADEATERVIVRQLAGFGLNLVKREVPVGGRGSGGHNPKVNAGTCNVRGSTFMS
jgi:hypothetical protein